MKRKIVKIDEELCNGCGDCLPNCPEGALQIIDGKARLLSDLFCDGLGACLNACPLGAITIEEREAEPYDETKVMENMVRQGPAVVRAHLDHLREHGETEFLQQALAYLKANQLMAEVTRDLEPQQSAPAAPPSGGCPGARMMQFGRRPPTEGASARSANTAGSPGNAPAGPAESGAGSEAPSELTHWPIQLHLMSPRSPAYRGADVLLAADCAAFARADFHTRFLKGRALAIACPKLDDGQEIYLEKLRALIDEAGINTLTVMIMEVPCCGGLLRLAEAAAQSATRKVPVKAVVVGLEGEIRSESWR